MKIFSGESSLLLAKKVADLNHVALGDCELSRFPNGENRIWIKENCENENVVVFQNFSAPVDQNIIQFCLMIDAIKRMNPKSIIGVIPWLGYAKQDKVFRSGEPLAAEVVAKIVSSLKLDKLFLLDIHHQNIKSFFSIPVEELSASDIFIDKIQSNNLAIQQYSNIAIKNLCVVAPDFGALEKNRYAATKLNLPLFQIDKERDLATGNIRIKGIKQIIPNSLQPTTYNLQPTHVLMFDDMILSGGTIVKDAEYLKTQGAADILFFATHLDPTSDTFQNLEKASVAKIVVTDSLSYKIPSNLTQKVTEISVSPVFLEVLQKF